MFWLNLALLGVIAGGLVVLLTSDRPVLWQATRLVARICFQGGAVLAVAWLLVTLAGNANAAVAGIPPSQVHDSVDHVARALAAAAVPSLLLIALAIFFGTGVGLGAAVAVTTNRRRAWRVLGILATVIWVLPTFMVAILAQEAQGLITSFTGLPSSGGYAQVTPLSVFWAAVVLGIRPAAYVYRQARVALDLEAIADHVRAGRARGLPESQIATRYVVRPAASALVAGWLNSIRVVVGALPLVEFFFAYPGIGQTLLSAIGLHYAGSIRPVPPDADLAIACALSLALILLLLESAALSAQLVLDPRLRETRAV